MKYVLVVASLIGFGIAYSQEQPLPNHVVTVKGFKIELKQCQKPSSKVITCSFVITNKEADRVIMLYDWAKNESYFADSGGMQIVAHNGKLGSSVRTSTSWAQTEAVTDVPVRGALDFNVGDPQATSLAKLSVGFDSDGPFRVDFRKIPLE
jgi:hypothetical protein